MKIEVKNDSLSEKSKKYPGTPDKNELKKRQQYHAKWNKNHKHSYYLSPNVGNNEYNIAMFNHMNGGGEMPITPFSASSETSSDFNAGSEASADMGAGVAENLNLTEIFEILDEENDPESLIESLPLNEASDARLSLKNKVKLLGDIGRDGVAFFDKSGKYLFGNVLSEFNLNDETFVKQQFNSALHQVGKNNVDSFLILHKGKVIRDSLSERTNDSAEIEVFEIDKESGASSPLLADELTALSIDLNGEIQSIAQKLYDASKSNSNRYQMHRAGKIIFDTGHPEKYAIRIKVSEEPRPTQRPEKNEDHKVLINIYVSKPSDSHDETLILQKSYRATLKFATQNRAQVASTYISKNETLSAYIKSKVGKADVVIAVLTDDEGEEKSLIYATANYLKVPQSPDQDEISSLANRIRDAISGSRTQSDASNTEEEDPGTNNGGQDYDATAQDGENYGETPSPATPEQSSTAGKDSQTTDESPKSSATSGQRRSSGKNSAKVSANKVVDKIGNQSLDDLSEEEMRKILADVQQYAQGAIDTFVKNHS